MTDLVRIRLGQSLSTQTGIAFCRLGAIVADREGRLFGLTARHILEEEAGGRVFDPSSGREVGAVAGDRPPLQEGSDFFDTIGIFTLDAVEVDWSDPASFVLHAVEPEVWIGRSVSKVQADCAPATGLVEGYGGSIDFQPAAERPTTLLRHVIELSFPEGSEATCRGEAGAPLIGARGALLGLLIGGTTQRAYAAPLKPFLDRYDYALLLPELGQSADASIDEQELEHELRSTAWGALQIRHDINLENVDARNPYKEEIPPRLIDLLAEVE